MPRASIKLLLRKALNDLWRCVDFIGPRSVCMPLFTKFRELRPQLCRRFLERRRTEDCNGPFTKDDAALEEVATGDHAHASARNGDHGESAGVVESGHGERDAERPTPRSIDIGSWLGRCSMRRFQPHPCFLPKVGMGGPRSVDRPLLSIRIRQQRECLRTTSPPPRRKEEADPTETGITPSLKLDSLLNSLGGSFDTLERSSNTRVVSLLLP